MLYSDKKSPLIYSPRHPKASIFTIAECQEFMEGAEKRKGQTILHDPPLSHGYIFYYYM